MGQIIKLREETDQCAPYKCPDCKGNGWEVFIYSSPKRMVLVCETCEAEITMDLY